MGVRSLIRAQQHESAVAFGQLLRRWRTANGWTQYTAGEFAAVAEPPMDAPSHSGASEIENAKIVQPRNAFFLFLAQLNARIADANFKGVRQRKLLDQLKGSKPITDDQGRPWGAAEFWSCHAGILAPPDWLAGEPEQLAPQLSDDEAAALGDEWKAQILAIGAAVGLRPARAVMAFVSSIPSAHREAVEEGLMAGFTSADVARLWDPAAGEWQPLAWISSWRAGLNPAESGGGGG